ncbi:MAG: M73 family metallopeptidase [Firmicutes bacterium]|nr:M73 family metallopeptidase [Bacillota bacterium]
MTLKKKFTLGLTLIMLLALMVMGTYAYLTSTPETVSNTFTIGDIEITLDESPVDEYGVVDATVSGRVTENDYKLVPGHTYVKDPTVHVLADSEACWLFVKVEDELTAIEDATTIANQITANGWTALGATYPGVYYKEQAAVTADTDVAVFANFKVKSDADLTNYNNKKIDITAYAIQKDGLSTAADAWTAVSAAASNTNP